MGNEVNSITARFKEIVRQLCGGPQQVNSKDDTATATQLHEREESITVALLAVLAGQNVFLLGPPGTAKSLMARRISNAFKNKDSKQEVKFFEYLMQKFSTPEEIFGPIDIAKLKQGTYYRNTTGYLPQADFAFLDEIWKSNPPILNTLLTITNERKFRNGDSFEKVQLKALIGASNETPPRGEGLEALWDRFVVRLYVGRLKSHDYFLSMIQESQVVADATVTPELAISTEEWEQWQKEIGLVKLSAETINAITHIKAELTKLEQENQQPNEDGKEKEKREEMALEFYISDRRWQRAVMLLKASAFFSGRDTTNHLDTLLLRHCLWNSSDSTGISKGKKCTRETIEEIVTSHVGTTLTLDMDFSDIDALLDKAEAYKNYDDTSGSFRHHEYRKARLQVMHEDGADLDDFMDQNDTVNDLEQHFKEPNSSAVGWLDEASAAISKMQSKINSHHEQMEVYLQNALVSDDADRFRKAIIAARTQVSSLQERLQRLQSKPVVPPAPTTYKCPITGMEFVFVKGGTFEMGDTFGEGEGDEVPVHNVALDDYYIGKYPVTHREWKKLYYSIEYGSDHDDLPVISKYETIAKWIKELNERIPGGGHCRLLTEAEWEYAARSRGEKEKYAGSNNADEVAWFEDNIKSFDFDSGTFKRAFVGIKKSNRLGIHDMSGNVMELCCDYYDHKYYSSSPINNPCNTDKSKAYRIVRGGDASSNMTDIRCSKRFGHLAIHIGFRLAISADSADALLKA